MQKASYLEPPKDQNKRKPHFLNDQSFCTGSYLKAWCRLDSLLSILEHKKINFGETPCVEGRGSTNIKRKNMGPKNSDAYIHRLFKSGRINFLRANIGSTIEDLKVPKSHFSCKFLSRLGKSTRMFA